MESGLELFILYIIQTKEYLDKITHRKFTVSKIGQEKHT